MTGVDAHTLSYDGPSPVLEVGRDMLRRGAMAAPVVVGLGALIWGTDGATSVAYAIAIVLGNFALSAYLLATAARISVAMLMGAAMFGFLIRMGILFVAVFAVKDAGWIDLVPLGIALVVAHLGLLVWELRYVSATLAYPGLKPDHPRASGPSSLVTKESVQP
ncbi:MAG: ATP synthase subunit I [Acidimicrobiales bacterium]